MNRDDLIEAVFNANGEDLLSEREKAQLNIHNEVMLNLNLLIALAKSEVKLESEPKPKLTEEDRERGRKNLSDVQALLNSRS